MRIVFVLPHQKAARKFEHMLARLGADGHEVHLALRSEDRAQADELIDGLCSDHPGITRGLVPVRGERWSALAGNLRRGSDYLRYLSPLYADAPKLRARGERWAPRTVVRIAGLPLVRSEPGLKLLGRVLRWMESAIPEDRALLEFMRERRPDLLLVSPLVGAPWQADHVRAARTLGIRSGLMVASWDNLTNKGLIREVPDRVYLWNDDQRREAVDLHGVPGERVVATGAHTFDHWFAWRPSCTAEEFRAKLELDGDRPILLYVCSSDFIAPDEQPFVERWLAALRSHADIALREVNVLVRPHPRAAKTWEEVRVDGTPNVAVWPRGGAWNVDADSKADYFDSLHHSAVVVGLNTSALIESAIVGRPVFTVLDPEYRETQEGTLHFHYLLREHGGPLTVAGGFDQHFAQLATALADDRPEGLVDPDFVRRFIRPDGLERPAVEVLAGALEDQVAAPAPAAEPHSLRRAAGGVMLRPLAALSTRARDAQEHRKLAARRRRKRLKRGRRAARRALRRVGGARLLRR